MSFLKVPNVALNPSLQSLIDDIWGLGSAQNVRVRLFDASHTPVVGDTVSTYNAIEADFDGYASVVIVPGDWTTPVLMGNKSVTFAPAAIFTAGAIGSPVSIYGYFVTDSNDPATVLLWAQQFDDPIALTNPGDPVVFTPQFTYSSEH